MFGPGKHRRAHEGEIGIPGQEGFGKDNKLRPLARGLGGRRQHAVERSGPRFEVRRDLRRRDANDGKRKP